jgi:hypothetical protein
MPAIARAAKQPSAPAVRDEAPEVPPIAPAARTLGVTSQEEPANKTAPRSPRRPLVRGGLFPLLPLALIAGANWYVTGGQVMSTDDAYVEAEKVGISTDFSGRRNAKRAKSAPAALANSARGRGGTSVPFRLAAGSAPRPCWFTSRRFSKAIFQGDEGPADGWPIIRRALSALGIRAGLGAGAQVAEGRWPAGPWQAQVPGVSSRRRRHRSHGLAVAPNLPERRLTVAPKRVWCRHHHCGDSGRMARSRGRHRLVPPANGRFRDARADAPAMGYRWIADGLVS